MSIKIKNILSKLQIDEISGVDKGANEGARVAFWKRDETEKGVSKMDVDQAMEEFEKMEAERNHFEVLAKMSDAEKAFMSEMDEEQKKRFMGMDNDARKAYMEKSKMKKSDEESEVNKADYEAIQKRAEELAEKVEKMEQERQFETFAKQAEKELPNLAGTTEEKGKLLKALHGLDEDARTLVMGELKKADKITSEYFVEKGTSATGGDDPSQELEKMAKSFASENKVDFNKAYAEVLKTEEGKRLYTKIQ